MQVNTMEVLTQFPIRKTKAQKRAFRDAVQAYAEKLDYPVFIEQGSLGSRNLIIGNLSQAKFLLSSGTALSGVAAWLEILRTFPENQRHRVCFLLFDGKTGMSSFRKRCRQETDNMLLIDLGHVGDGSHLRYFPTKLLKLDRVWLTSLYRSCGYFGSRDLLIEEKKKPLNLKYCATFPYAVTICALQDHKKGMRYNSTTKSTALDATNVNILRAALTTFICCNEVN